MLSSIQRADAAAGILTAALSLLMCPCSCLIKNFCLVQHQLLSPFLFWSETVLCQRGQRDIHRDILGSWVAVVALVLNHKLPMRQCSCYPEWATTGRSILPSNLKWSRKLKAWLCWNGWEGITSWIYTNIWKQIDIPDLFTVPYIYLYSIDQNPEHLGMVNIPVPSYHPALW